MRQTSLALLSSSCCEFFIRDWSSSSIPCSRGRSSTAFSRRQNRALKYGYGLVLLDYGFLIGSDSYLFCTSLIHGLKLKVIRLFVSSGKISSASTFRALPKVSLQQLHWHLQGPWLFSVVDAALLRSVAYYITSPRCKLKLLLVFVPWQ